MNRVVWIFLIFLLVNSCAKNNETILTRYELEEFLDMDKWQDEMLFYSQGNNPTPFSIDKTNLNTFNLFADWTDVSPSYFYVHSSGNYSEKSSIKFEQDKILLRTSQYHTGVSTYGPFKDYNVQFHPYDFTIFSTNMDVEREWSETKNITIDYHEYDFSGTVIDSFSETVSATFEYTYREYEDGVTFKGVYNPDDYYYDAVSLGVKIDVNSSIFINNIYNTYYFAKDQGLVGFRTNEKVFRIDY